MGGSVETRLLDIRVFGETTKNIAYKKQTEQAEQKGISNCPICAISNNLNKTKIWKIKEMETDHN